MFDLTLAMNSARLAGLPKEEKEEGKSVVSRLHVQLQRKQTR